MESSDPELCDYMHRHRWPSIMEVGSLSLDAAP